jgi:hypothetical protein
MVNPEAKKRAANFMAGLCLGLTIGLFAGGMALAMVGENGAASCILLVAAGSCISGVALGSMYADSLER